MLLAFVSLGAQAKNACASIHHPLIEIQSGFRAPTVTEALEIVGEGPAPVLVRKALDFVFQMPPQAFQARVQIGRLLFDAIKTRSSQTWTFDKFTASDGSIGYVGDQGYFVLFKATGQILKGTFRIERDLNDYYEWNGHADQIYEYQPNATWSPAGTPH